MAVDALAGKSLLIPMPQQPVVDIIHISWHYDQVLKGRFAELRPIFGLNQWYVRN
jgi:hypothetical protein